MRDSAPKGAAVELNMVDAFLVDVLAEETHSGRAWSLIILLAVFVPLIGVGLCPPTAVRWPLILLGPLGLYAWAMAWSGFQYRFLRDGGRDSDAWVPAAVDSEAIDCELFNRALGLYSGLRHSRPREHTGVCVVQQGGAHQDVERRGISGAQRSGAGRA